MDWEITRQELMLFHAKHKRMRIVPWHKTVPVETTQVKKDNKDEAFIEYRRHAQNILDALKENFKEKLPLDSEITLYDPDDQIKVRDASRKLIIEKVPGKEDKKISILTYLVYWRMCLHYEDWGKNSIPDKILLEIIKQIGAPPKNGEESNFKVTIDIDFEDHHLSALLSTLPISPDWDLWGVFTDKNTEKEPTSLDKIQNCIRPVYAAQIKYYGKNNAEGPSHKVVGYSIQLRACYTDTVRNDTTTNFISERDYYEYCHNPADSKELGFYQAYGIFYDALTFALSGEQNTNGEKNEDGTPKEKNVFYIAYQIKTSLDRRHFWHITLRPKDQDEAKAKEATLEELWSAWWPIHQRILDWPTLHDSIATEFEQLDFAYARAEIFTDITDPERKDDEFSAEESVCKHAYMLFPIRCARYKDKVWAYQKYIINKSKHFKEAVNKLKQHHDILNDHNIGKLLQKTIGKKTKFELGFEWEDLTKNPTQYRKHISDLNKKKKEMSENDDIVFRNVYETADKCLQHQRYRRLIDQQLISARQMFAKHESEKSMRKSALQSAVAQVFARNFAHNIGSHVAVRATNRMAKERIAELYNFKDANNKTDTTKFKEAIVNWLDYMGEKLDLFEVARNEFLAEYKLPAKNVMLYRDVILPFCENTLLMDNIAHSEGIHYKYCRNNKLKIKVRIDGSEIKASYPNLASYDGSNNISYPDNFPYLVKSKDTLITIDEAFALKELSGSSDIEICLTNEHTIYSILENLIRNSAKHNKDKLGDNDLIITVHITDGDDDYYTIQIYDNVSKVSQEQLNGFANSISDSLITDEGEIQKKNLGIVDIKINAHLLKTDAAITNENLKKSLKLICNKNGDSQYGEYKKIESNPSDEEEYNFGYQFKLCKPKKVVWIGNNINASLEHKKKGLISYPNVDTFKPERQSTKEEPLASYQFAILELDAVRHLKNETGNYQWDDLLVKLPHRVLLNADSNEINSFDEIRKLIDDKRVLLVEDKFILPTNTDTENWDVEFLKSCWKNWLRKWVEKAEQAKLIVYFEDHGKATDWNNANIYDGFLNVHFLTSCSAEINIDTIDILVLYDHHGYGKEKLNGNIQFITRGAYFQFDKNSLDFVNFFYPSPAEKRLLFLYEAYEAGLSKVLVLDERICELLKPTDDSNISKITMKKKGYKAFKNGGYANLANNGNIFIVTKFQNTGIVMRIANLEVTCCVENKISLNFPELSDLNSIECDALIIHRTYLAALFKDLDNQQKESLMHCFYQKFKRVVVVSGGGHPHSLGLAINFKPYSQLKSSFIKYPSKVSLVKMI